MIEARFLDGRTARPHTAEVEIVGCDLRIAAADAVHVWPLKGLTVVIEGDQARVSWPEERDARLVMAKADWLALGGAGAEAAALRSRGRETQLVVGLAVFAAVMTAFVFIGVPALSGPLARATPVSFETGMGQNFDNQVGALFHTCDGRPGQEALTALGHRLAAQSDTPFNIRVRAVQAPMVNAFALPGGPILITDDLIREAQSPDEVSAVIAHEVSHIEKRHVMQAVWRSLGIGLLLDAVVGGGSGAGQQAVLLAGQATDLRYGRAAESEADARGQQLLHAEGLSSKGMASFFARLGGRRADDDVHAVEEFISTHPDSARRARVARAAERPGASALTASEWQAVRSACSEDQSDPLEEMRRRLGLDRKGSTAPPQP